MKTAVKVFLILSIVSGGLLALVGLVSVIGGIAAAGYGGSVLLLMGFMYLLVSVLPIIFSAVGLKKLSAARCAADISTAWKVLILLFGSLVAGILLLCMKDSDFSGVAPAPALTPANNYDSLVKLKELLDMGAITQEEFEAKKREILGA